MYGGSQFRLLSLKHVAGKNSVLQRKPVFCESQEVERDFKEKVGYVG
jgi:hypothetical protein